MSSDSSSAMEQFATQALNRRLMDRTNREDSPSHRTNSATMASSSAAAAAASSSSVPPSTSSASSFVAAAAAGSTANTSSMQPIGPIDWKFIRSTRKVTQSDDSSILPDLLFLPSEIAASVIGSFLRDIDAAHWAQCSRRSLEQLQQYLFKKHVPVPCMLRLSSSTLRPPAAFGQVSRVCIEIGLEQCQAYQIPNLPRQVRSVTIRPQRILLQQDEYSLTEEEANPRCALGLFYLPSTVDTLVIEGCEKMEHWLHHLRFSGDSSLRVLRAKCRDHMATWRVKSMPPCLRDSLPSTLVDLELPKMEPSNKVDSESPSLYGRELYPTEQWPPNLTRLAIECNSSSPFVAGLLPPLPATLTDFPRMWRGDGRVSEARFRNAVKQLPDSITSLHLLGTGNISSSWKFPLGLTSLTVDFLRRIAQLPGQPPFAFPSSLRTLSLAPFQQFELLSSILPASLTSLTLSAPTAERAFEGMQWPEGLLFLKFVNTRSIAQGPSPSSSLLRYWTPPPQLTSLDLASHSLYVDDVPFPPTLTTLSLSDYNRSLSGIVFPPSIKHLSIFNREAGMPSLKRGMWQPPPQLTALDLSYYEDDLFLPPTLTRLNPTSAFHPTSFKKLSEVLPNSLLQLDFTVLRPQDGFEEFVFPPKLRSLRLSWINCLEKCEELPRAEQFPQSLREVWARDFTFSRFSRRDPAKVPRILEWAAKSLPPDCAFFY